MVHSYVNTRNFVVVTVKAYEGAVTRIDNSVSPTGGLNDGALVYTDPIAKGNVVRLTDVGINGVIKVQNNTGKTYGHGVAVSDPFGVDSTTTSGSTPSTENMRKYTRDLSLYLISQTEYTFTSTCIIPRLIAGQGASNTVIFVLIQRGTFPTLYIHPTRLHYKQAPR
jgi:hypothetical protein